MAGAREYVERDLKRIEDKEIDLKELATALERELEERKHELRQQYGISNRS